MKRPQQHITEDESRKQFALLIPNGWVTNDFAKDYGKDINVEIFRDHASTGQMFLCQLKGSTQTITNETIKVPIEVETLRYFGTLNQPVLLVFYSTQTKRFWAQWANYLILLHKLKENQKTITVTMTDKHLIDSQFFKVLERNFETIVARKINVTFSGNSVNQSVYQAKFRKWLERYFLPNFEYENYQLPFEFEIVIDDKEDKTSITLKSLGEIYPLAPVGVDEFLAAIYKPVLSEGSISPLEAEFLYLASSFFSSQNFEASLLVLSFALTQYEGKYKTERSLLEIGRLAVQLQKINAFQRLIGVVITHGTLSDFQFLNYALFIHDIPRTLINHYRDNLIAAIAQFPGDNTTAFLHYNLAGYYRIYHEYYLASHHYQTARKLDPEYCKRFYWWHEYAGVLYMSGHSYYSAFFYEQSIALDEEKRNLPLTYALLADCMFQFCAFEVANGLLQRYQNEVIALNKLPSIYFGLLQDLCASFTKFGFNGITRQPELSKDLTEKGNVFEDIELFRQAVNCDPLNAEAWYNFSILTARGNDQYQAYHAALAAALIFGNNREAWLRCFRLQYAFGDNGLIMTHFCNLVKLFGDTIINDLTNYVVSDTKLTANEKTEHIAIYERLLREARQMLMKEYAPPAEIVRINKVQVD